MKVPLQVWVAVIGLLGVLAGAVIQGVVTKFGAKMQRESLFESYLNEQRATLYITILQFVAAKEARANRYSGTYSPESYILGERKPALPLSELENADPGTELEARLSAFSSMLVKVLFSQWRYFFVCNDQASLVSLLAQTLLEIPDIEHPSQSDVDLAAKLTTASGFLARQSADLLGRQIRAEFSGKVAWHTRPSSIRQRIRDKKQRKWNSRHDEMLETELPALRQRLERLNEQLNQIEVNGQLALW